LIIVVQTTTTSASTISARRLLIIDIGNTILVVPIVIPNLLAMHTVHCMIVLVQPLQCLNEVISIACGATKFRHDKLIVGGATHCTRGPVISTIVVSFINNIAYGIRMRIATTIVVSHTIKRGGACF
jgi:hypothetical protein